MRHAVLVLIAGSVTTAAIAAQSPYQGEAAREIKALSQQEINGYLNGRGMGYAKAAELNHYPGPRHVLDLADELGLSAEQSRQTRAIYETMRTRAAALGRKLVQRERELDRLFADRTIDEERLSSLASDIGMLQADIRRVHLAAHLQQRSLLSERQVRRYSELRGYGSEHGAERQHVH